MIKLSEVALGEQEEKLVLEVLRSGHIAQGPQVARLEELFAAAVGVPHAIAVSTGTAALFLALEALELSPGDEVITTPFTFMATLNAIVATGATARLADIGDDYQIDPDSVRELVSAKTKAILPVHLYGLPADMEAIAQVAAEHGLAIVEDAAQAVGAFVGQKAAGSWGIGCFSLYATKNITTAEGGVITTDDDAVAERLRIARNQGMRRRYEYVMAGFNHRMTDVHAAIGVPQMERLAELTAKRRSNAAALSRLLSHLGGARLPIEPPDRKHVYHQYTIELTEAAPPRDEVVTRLAAAGVQAGIYYPRLVNDYDHMRDNPQVVNDPTPRARRAARSVVSLPIHPGLAESDIERVAEATLEAVDG